MIKVSLSSAVVKRTCAPQSDAPLVRGSGLPWGVPGGPGDPRYSRMGKFAQRKPLTPISVVLVGNPIIYSGMVADINNSYEVRIATPHSIVLGLFALDHNEMIDDLSPGGYGIEMARPFAVWTGKGYYALRPPAYNANLRYKAGDSLVVGDDGRLVPVVPHNLGRTVARVSTVESSRIIIQWLG